MFILVILLDGLIYFIFYYSNKQLIILFYKLITFYTLNCKMTKITIFKYLKTLFSIFVLFFILYNLFFKYFFTLNFNKFLIKILIYLSFFIQTMYILRFFTFIKYIYELLYKVYVKLYWEPLNYFFETYIKNISGLGDFLFFFAKKFNSCCFFLGKFCFMYICVIFYVVPMIIILCYLLFNLLNIIPLNFNYFLIITNIIIMRITTIFIFILNDFAIKNRQYLDTLLIITKVDNFYKYDFNYKTIKKPTQEKLNLLSSRYETFRYVDVITTAYITFKKEKINKILEPFIIGIFYICTLQFCLYNIFNFQLNYLFFLLILCIILISEFYQKVK
jgi:hypothetical protein